MNTKFGGWLFQWRVGRGMSVRALAETLGVSGAYISALETGRNVVSKAFLENLLKLNPKLPAATLRGYFTDDVLAHKALKKSRTELLVWARALASVEDKKQAEKIRLALANCGIELPK